MATEHGRRQPNSSVSIVEQAQQYFPGHQEFFYIFVQSTDSHKFSFHLRHQIVRLLKKELSNVDYQPSQNFERILLRLQMLSRFLGVLIFSPSWHGMEAACDYSFMGDLIPPDGLLALESDVDGGISLSDHIGEAWKEGNLVKVIPWATEMLKMATWDPSLHTRSKTYRNILCLLREIQEKVSSRLYRNQAQHELTPCLELVLLCLETFFGEAVGLSTIAHFPASKSGLPDRNKESISSRVSDRPSLDESFLTFSTTLLFVGSPHLEDLFSLAAAMSRTDIVKSARSPGVSRKLRPLVVSGTIASGSTMQYQSTAALPLPAGKAEANTLARRGNTSLETRLVDTFFHQHREVKEICEFSVHQILKRMASLIPDMLLNDTLQESASLSTGEEEGFGKYNGLVEASLKYLRSSLEDGVHQALLLLEPPNTHPIVHNMALSLAVARGFETGAPYVTNLATNDLNPLKKSLFGNKTKTAKETTESPLEQHTDQEHLLMNMAAAAQKLQTSLANPSHSFDSIHQLIQSLEALLDDWLTSSDPKIPKESVLREYFESVARLDQYSVALIESCIGTDTDAEQKWLVMACFLSLASKLCRRPRRGLYRLIRRFRDPAFLYRVVRWALDVENLSSNKLPQLLIQMVDGDVIAGKGLEQVLIQHLEKDTKVLELSRQLTSLLDQSPNLVYEFPILRNSLK